MDKHLLLMKKFDIQSRLHKPREEVNIEVYVNYNLINEHFDDVVGVEYHEVSKHISEDE